MDGQSPSGYGPVQSRRANCGATTDWIMNATGLIMYARFQGLALVHFLAQRERFLWDRGLHLGGIAGAFRWDRGCIQGVFRGHFAGVRGDDGICRVYLVSETAQVELKS